MYLINIIVNEKKKENTRQYKSIILSTKKKNVVWVPDNKLRKSSIINTIITTLFRIPSKY